MSTIKTTNITHGSNTGTSNLVLDSSGNATVNGNATVTGNLSVTGSFTKVLSEVDQWYVTTNQTVDTDPVTAFARVSSSGSASPLGTGMSVSSGIFTFPSTGKWLIFAKAKFSINDHDSVNFNIFVTTDNSSYNFVATCADGLNGSGQNRDGGDATMYFLDVTDTSQVKVKFTVGSLGSGSKLMGGSDFTSGVLFMRIGDT